MSIDSATERYRRRRRWPILTVVTVLLVGAGILWFQVLKPPPALATGCNQPGPAPTATATSRSVGASGASGSASAAPSTGTAAKPTTGTATTLRTAPTTLGTFVPTSTLVATRPAAPRNIALQVSNASPTKGLALAVTNDLQAAGFESIKKPQNDDLYPAHDLICQSMIRFGQAGTAEARTLLIVAPCAQLVMDGRVDRSVDLALGSLYTFTPVTKDMITQLKALNVAANAPAVIEGQTAAPRPLASIPPLPKADCTPTQNR